MHGVVGHLQEERLPGALAMAQKVDGASRHADSPLGIGGVRAAFAVGGRTAVLVIAVLARASAS